MPSSRAAEFKSTESSLNNLVLNSWIRLINMSQVEQALDF